MSHEHSAIGGMEGSQLYNPELIYVLNRNMAEFWKDANNHGVQIVPNLFSKHTRTFHWMAVDENFMCLNDAFGTDAKVEKITGLKIFKTDEAATNWWLDFSKELPEFRHFRAAIELVNRLRNSPDLLKEILANNEEKTKLHRALLTLYGGYHHPPRLYVDGIVYRAMKIIRDISNPVGIGHAVFELVPDDESCKTREEYEWVKAAFYSHENVFIEELKGFYCQEADDLNLLLNPITPPNNLKHYDPRETTKLAYELAEIIAPRIAKDEKPVKFIIVPVYDAWIRGKGYGSIWCNLTLFFKDEGTLNAFVKENLREFQVGCEALSEELLSAATTLSISKPIKPPYDLLELFVDSLVIIQDWERILVYRKGKDGSELPLYCYERKQENSVKTRWGLCESKVTINEPACPGCRHKTSMCMNWPDDVWTDTMIPGLISEEQQEFEDIRLRLWYPETAVIPAARDKEFFEAAYLRQQLDLLRGLIPKVRARRAALRNAAAAIIGRNMSHNIGSHVLARYSIASGELKEDAKQLLRFLQERMDFIAEMTTTDVYFGLPTWFYQDALHPFQDQKVLLRYITGLEGLDAEVVCRQEDKEDQRFSCPSGRTGMHALYVILENVIRNTAKHAGTVVTVPKVTGTWTKNEGAVCLTIKSDRALEAGEKWVISCAKLDVIQGINIPLGGNDPDGVRLVRNLLIKGRCETVSASSLASGISVLLPENSKNEELAFDVVVSTSSLQISVRIMPVGNGYFEVVVWDNKKNGCVLVPCRNQIQGEDKKMPLYARINALLEEPLIDDSGNTAPDGWGVREMQLAAAYLRGVPMKELEGRPAAEEPPILEALPVGDDGLPCPTQADIRKKAPECTQCERKHDGCASNLGYRFYLKEAQVLLVTRSNASKYKVKEGPGIEIVESGEIRKVIARGSSHSFALIAQQDLKNLDLVENELARLPLLCFESLSQPDEDIEQELAAQWCSEAGGSSYMPVYVTDTDIQGKKNVLASNTTNHNKPEQLLVFDHHYQMIKVRDRDSHAQPFVFGVDVTELFKSGRATVKPGELGFYEPHGAPDPQYALLLHQNRDLYRALFVAVAVSRVVLLDERVQAGLEVKVSTGHGKGQLLSWMKVEVPTKNKMGCDLDHPTADAIDSWISSLKKHEGHTYFVIHQGIIDKLRKLDGWSDSKLEEWLVKVGAQQRLIVCSGRGSPRGALPNGARFVPVSSVLEWTLHRPSKFHLVYTLVHARRPGEASKRS